MAGAGGRRLRDRMEGASTVIQAGTVLRGHIGGEANVVVLGTVEGDCDLDGMLVLQTGSCWTGDIRADAVLVAGRVDGTIHARGALELLPGAVVTGDVRGATVAIAEGAILDGRLDSAGGAPPVRFTERRRAPEDAGP